MQAELALFASMFINMLLAYILIKEEIRFYPVLKKIKKSESIDQKNENHKVECDIVGKSKTMFPAVTGDEPEPEPDPIPEVHTEPDILPEEVEHIVDKMEQSDYEELTVYLEHNEGSIEEVGELNQGLTFEEINHALNTVKGKSDTEDDILNAGRTLAFMPAEFIDAICLTPLLSDRVKFLMKANLDASLAPPKKSRLENFKIEDYI
jgi:hypothetical protein